MQLSVGAQARAVIVHSAGAPRFGAALSLNRLARVTRLIGPATGAVFIRECFALDLDRDLIGQNVLGGARALLWDLTAGGP
jgi:hypothetical protein